MNKCGESKNRKSQQNIHKRKEINKQPNEKRGNYNNLIKETWRWVTNGPFKKALNYVTRMVSERVGEWILKGKKN